MGELDIRTAAMRAALRELEIGEDASTVGAVGHAQALATIYVGDQLARIADAQAAKDTKPLAPLAPMLARFPSRPVIEGVKPVPILLDKNGFGVYRLGLVTARTMEWEIADFGDFDRLEACGALPVEPDGRSLSRHDYPELYRALGDRYGDAPEGEFRIPDLTGMGKVVRGE
jgi:hypothetical protein